MNTAITNEPVKIADPFQVSGNEDLQKLIVNRAKELWDKGLEARKPYDDRLESIWRLYRTEEKEQKDTRRKTESAKVLPWTYTAVQNWCAFMSASTYPNDSDVFYFKGRTQEDESGCELLTEYVKYRLERDSFDTKYFEYLVYAALGRLVLKVIWSDDKYSPGPSVDLIEPCDFVCWPTIGNFKTTVKIHRLWKFYEDLLEAHEQLGAISPYFNLEKLSFKDEKDARYKPDTDEEKNRQKDGLELKEVYFPRLKLELHGQTYVYRDVVALIAKDEHLIRFGPNPYADTCSPFILFSLVPDGSCLFGRGLTDAAHSIQLSANVLFNTSTENMKFQSKPMFKYLGSDDEFNPYAFVARPGALVRVGTMENLQPLREDLDKMQLNLQVLSEYKNEFEEATIPRIIKGQFANLEKTAEEARRTDNNATSVITQQAKRLNNCVLKGLFEKYYYLIYTKLTEGDVGVALDFMRCTQNRFKSFVDPVTGQPHQVAKTDSDYLADFMAIKGTLLNAPEVDVKVVGYQNVNQREQQLLAMERVGLSLGQTPFAEYLPWDKWAEASIQLAGLNKDQLLPSDEDKARIDQGKQKQAEAAAQQAVFMQQLQQQTVVMQHEKIRLDHEYDMRKLDVDAEIGAAKLELEAKKAAAQLARQANVNSMADSLPSGQKQEGPPNES